MMKAADAPKGARGRTLKDEEAIYLEDLSDFDLGLAELAAD
jgi:hypothetical protein